MGSWAQHSSFTPITSCMPMAAPADCAPRFCFLSFPGRVEMVAENKRHNVIIGRAAGRLLHAKLASAWNTWFDNTQETKVRLQPASQHQRRLSCFCVACHDEGFGVVGYGGLLHPYAPQRRPWP